MDFNGFATCHHISIRIKFATEFLSKYSVSCLCLLVTICIILVASYHISDIKVFLKLYLGWVHMECSEVA